MIGAAAAPLVTSMFMIESGNGSCTDGTNTLAGADGACDAGSLVTGMVAGAFASAGAPLAATCETGAAAACFCEAACGPAPGPPAAGRLACSDALDFAFGGGGE